MSRDLWEEKMLEKKQILQECQASRELRSCLPCDKINDCEIRDTYVKSVYESMSKGKGGGFEF